MAWVYCASLGLSWISILLDVWEAFDFVALWAPFLEWVGFWAISAVWGVLDSLDMGALRVALGYRMCRCFHETVQSHYFTNTSVIFTKYIIVCRTWDLDVLWGWLHVPGLWIMCFGVVYGVSVLGRFRFFWVVGGWSGF